MQMRKQVLRSAHLRHVHIGRHVNAKECAKTKSWKEMFSQKKPVSSEFSVLTSMVVSFWARGLLIVNGETVSGDGSPAQQPNLTLI